MSADTNRHWSTRRTRIVPTAPPSARFSKRTVLDEASRPTAPEPAPEVSFTAPGIAVGRHLVDVHDHYRGELRELRGLLDRVTRGVITAGQARGELNRFALRANNWALGGVCQRQCVSFAVLTDTMLSHFAYEERELIAPLAQHGFYPGQVR